MADGRRLRRGIYLLPTCFTVGNLFCGFFSVIESSRGLFEIAAILIILAGLLDGLDGRIARLSGTTSEFGTEFDSLADVVSFGVAPAFLVYRWGLIPLARPGWLVAFLYVVCTAARLARFNIRGHREDRRHFAGLPSPPAAGLLAALVFAFPQIPAGVPLSSSVAFLVAVVGGLMVSRFRYRSFKDLDLRNRRPFRLVLPIALALIAVFTHPKSTMLTLAAIYAAAGPSAWAWGRLRRVGREPVSRRDDAAPLVVAQDRPHRSRPAEEAREVRSR